MRDIEGIDRAVAKLKPHWAAVEEWLGEQNERFLAHINRDHDELGRILKAHLIVESFMTEFLGDRLGHDELEAADLSFFKKACLLPSSSAPGAFVKPGILVLNRIRNRFGHHLEPEIHSEELRPIDQVLEVARPGVTFQSAVEKVEAFAAVACAFLLVAPANLREVVDEAFAEVRVPPELELVD
jgi:hypothetical protein